MKYTWLLFDADDTLFDYPKAEAKALAWTFEAVGLTYLPDYLPVYHKYNRQVWQAFEQGRLSALDLRTKRFALLFNEIGLDLDAGFFGSLYLKNLATGSDLIPGTAETLAAISKGHHIGLVTNGFADVQRPRLENSSIHPYIEKIFISEEMGTAKPEPAYFDIAFREMGDPPRNEVLIIGDSLATDMAGGIRYGIHTCWFNPARQLTDLPVTYQIQSLPDLIQYLS